MKQRFLRFLDFLTPLDIRELEHNEEQARARVLIIVLLNNVAGLTLALLACLFIDVPTAFQSGKVQICLVICIAIYLLAIGIFRRTGLYVISGNLYALTCYCMVIATIFLLAHPESPTFLLHLLAIPMITALIANYASSVIWLGIVAVTPIILSYLGKGEVDALSVSNWVATCVAIFIAIYIGHYYREIMARRLNTQNARLEFTAAHDSLTGLANRATFETQMERSIESCKSNGTKAVLVYIDLDKFKPINDTYGHQAGDAVLRAVADRLRRLVRNTDTVARLGGDEFAILFDQCNPASMNPVVDRIGIEVGKPIKAMGQSLTVGCSIGAVICPDDGADSIQLSHKADERMYEVKRATRKIGSV